jgi:hypothetical protein
MRLSRLFIEKWISTFGYAPDETEINKMIDYAVTIQKFRKVKQKDGSMFNVLEIYWNVEENIIFKADTDAGKLITFFTIHPLGAVGVSNRRLT